MKGRSRKTGMVNGIVGEPDVPRIALLRTDCGVPALVRVLEEKGAEVFEATQSGRISSELRRFQPDTIALGLCSGAPYRALQILKDLDGDLVERALVLLLVPEFRVEMLSPYFDAGVDDVVSPPHSASAILLRRWIRLRGPGRDGIGPALAREFRLGSLQIDVARRQVAGGDHELELSGREFELLLQLFDARGDVVSRDDLLADIWGQKGGSEAVLDATVHRLRRKLDRAGAEGGRVTTVRGVGYQLDLDAEPPSVN